MGAARGRRRKGKEKGSIVKEKGRKGKEKGRKRKEKGRRKEKKKGEEERKKKEEKEGVLRSEQTRTVKNPDGKEPGTALQEVGFLLLWLFYA